MTYWMVVLIGIVEGWGVGHAILMRIVSKLADDQLYENGLTEKIMQAFGLWARMKLKG